MVQTYYGYPHCGYPLLWLPYFYLADLAGEGERVTNL